MAEQKPPSVLEGPHSVIVVWTDESREPAKFNCLGYSFEGGFAIFDLEWFKGHKTLSFPSHTIASVEIMDEEARAGYQGYRDSSGFREQPGECPWFAAMSERRDD